VTSPTGHVTGKGADFGRNSTCVVLGQPLAMPRNCIILFTLWLRGNGRVLGQNPVFEIGSTGSLVVG
jgi:hypothetical protein